MKSSHLMEKFIQYLPIACGMLIGILNLTGALNKIPWLIERIPTITLTLLSIALIPLIIKMDKAEEKNSQNIVLLKERLDSLDGKNVKKFPTQLEIYRYFRDRFSTVTSSIDVTDLDSFDSRNFESEEREEYHKAFSQIIKNKIIRVRRIHILSDLVDYDRMCSNLKNNSGGKYCAGYYIGKKFLVPFPSIMVIDEDEVCFAPPIRNYGSSTCISVKNKAFANVAKEYIELLWNNKEGYIDNIEDQDNLNKLSEIKEKILSLQ